MTRLRALLCLAAPLAFAQSAPAGYPFASPRPSFDRPRKIVMSLSEREPDRVNEVLSNVGNVQRFYGPDSAKIALVAYGPGIHAVLTADSTVAPRIRSLIAIGVEVLACDATLQTLHKGPGDLIAGVRIVPNGLPEIVERQAAGWYYVRP